MRGSNGEEIDVDRVDNAALPVRGLGEPLLTAAEVAEFLRVDKTTIYRLASRADLPSIEVAPRVLRFRPEDIRQFLQRRTRKPPRGGRGKRLLGDRS